MGAFRGLFTRFKVNADHPVLGGAGHAKMGPRIEKGLSRFAGGDVDVHFLSGAGIGPRIQRCAGR